MIDAFVDAMFENPEDDTARLILADYLQEQEDAREVAVRAASNTWAALLLFGIMGEVLHSGRRLALKHPPEVERRYVQLSLPLSEGASVNLPAIKTVLEFTVLGVNYQDSAEMPIGLVAHRLDNGNLLHRTTVGSYGAYRWVSLNGPPLLGPLGFRFDKANAEIRFSFIVIFPEVK